MQPILAAEGQFIAYGPSHLAALAVFLAGAVLAILLGRSVRGTGLENLVSRSSAGVMLAVEIGFQLYSMRPVVWGLEHSLPFELCDLAWIVGGYALWTRRRWACGMLYYWALTLTLQALLTPKLSEDFPSAVFLMFFISHTLTVWAAIYITWGLGVAPTWRSLRWTIAVTIAWGLAMLIFNTFTGTNYLYVSHKPQTAGGSLMDLFPPWPWYLGVELLIGLTIWTLITLPWYARIRSSKPAQ